MSAALLALALLAAPPPAPGTPPAVPEASPRMIPQPQSQMPRTGQATLSFRVPVYPKAKTPAVPVGDQLFAHGMPMYVQSFYTDDDAHTVLDWYKNFFDTWGLPMMGDGDFTEEFKNPSITVFDDLNGVDLHVICVPGDQNGKTLVMLAMADITTFEANLDKAAALKWGGLPQYPGVETPTSVTSTDSELRSTSVTFQSPDSADQIEAFYRKTFAALHFHEGPPAEDPAAKELTFGQSKGTWRMVIKPGALPGETGVFATWTNRPMEEP